MKRNGLEKLLSNPSVIVVIVPAVAFLMAYVYRIGFFLYFKIPLSFLVVSAKDVSIMASILIAFLLLLLSFDTVLSAIVLDPFFRKYENDKEMTAQQYNLYCSFVAFFLLDIALFILGFWPLLFVSLIPLVIIPIQFVVGHKKYDPEVKAVSNKKKERHYYCPGIVFSILGTKTTTVLFLVSSIVLFTAGLGLRVASLKTTFYCVDNRDDIVGIVLSDDSVIAKRVDDSSLNETIILRITDTSVIKQVKAEEYASLLHDQFFGDFSIVNWFKNKTIRDNEFLVTNQSEANASELMDSSNSSESLE